MARVRVFEKKKGEDVTYLMLGDTEDGVEFWIVDEDGNMKEGGYLLHICNDKKIKRSTGVYAEHGFELDEDNRVIIE